jgi:hypothetical protein
MTTRVTRTQTHVAPRVIQAKAVRVAEEPKKAAEVPAEDPGAIKKMGEFLDKTGAADALKKAINAESSDEVIAALTGGVAQLVIERTLTKDLDKKLHEDYKGTINAHVKNETAKKALLALGEVFGDKVASNMISAGIGALAGTTTELLKDEKFRELYKSDPKAFGLELAKRGGKNFGVALLAAWGTAKLEEVLPAGLKWLAQLSFVRKLFGKE